MPSVSGAAVSAEKLSRKLVELMCRTDNEAISSLVNAQNLNLKKAGETFSGAIATSYGKSLLNSIIDTYAKCRKLEDAYLLYVKAVEAGFDLGAVTTSIIVNSLTNAGTIWTTPGNFHLLHCGVSW